MRVHKHQLKAGITRSAEFERKGLASFAVNVGTKCGHDCLYCSSGAMLRMHRSFAEAGESPFGHGYAIVDPDTPTRVAKDARRIRQRGVIQLCTTTDAWSPEAQEHELGRRCLQAILAEPGWSVRILTKNAAVVKDFDVMAKHRDRVQIGLSITATPGKSDIVSVVEPNASPVSLRMDALKEAHALGLRTYAMLCPLLPGVASSQTQINELIRFSVSHGAEETFVEPVNGRGPGLADTQAALERHGFPLEARAIEKTRSKQDWSDYVLRLFFHVQLSMRLYSDISKLRFLLYPSRLTAAAAEAIRRDDEGVVWLGKNADAFRRRSCEAL